MGVESIQPRDGKEEREVSHGTVRRRGGRGHLHGRGEHPARDGKEERERVPTLSSIPTPRTRPYHTRRRRHSTALAGMRVPAEVRLGVRGTWAAALVACDRGVDAAATRPPR